MTLAIVHDDTRVLLGLKKRGFGVGRWNGFGGKVGDDETIEEVAKRELFEESGLRWMAGRAAGLLRFSFERESKKIEMHIFRVTHVSGEPMETEEMKPQWFDFSDIPFHDMWPDDRFWLPGFLEGKKVNGSFHFGNEQIILKYELHFSTQ